jgi:hypothetical protein
MGYIEVCPNQSYYAVFLLHNILLIISNQLGGTSFMKITTVFRYMLILKF